MKKLRFLAAVLAVLLLLFAVGCKKEEETPTPTPDDGDQTNTPFASGEIEGTEITWEVYRDGTLRIKGEGEMGEELFEHVDLQHNDQPWQEWARSGSEQGVVIKKAIVEEGVSGLTQKCFQNMIYLELVELPVTLTSIPRDCFNGCTALKRVFGKAVTTVGDNAFQNCARLQRLTFSVELSLIEQGAFHGAGTESDRFELRLAGTEAEWNGGAGLSVVDAEAGNKFFADAAKAPVFVSK